MNNKKQRLLCLFSSCMTPLLLFNSSGHADEMFSTPEESRTRVVPRDESIKEEGTYKKLYNDELEKQLGDIRSRLKNQLGSGGVAPPTPPQTDISPASEFTSHPAVSNPPQVQFLKPPKQKNPSTRIPPQPDVLFYNVKSTAKRKKTVVPALSFAHATVISGVEAGANEPYPMLLSINGPFITPNNRNVDLSNCFVLAKVKANLSTERAIGETSTLSCLRENGEHIERQAQGYLSGADSSFGLQGKLLSNQKQIFLTSVLASLAKGAGEAVAMAQKTTSIAPSVAGAAGQSATNVTGSTAVLAAGQATTDAASMIAEWYLTYAKQLVPSIAIGSGGQDVWVTLLETIEMPSLKNDEDDDENTITTHK